MIFRRKTKLNLDELIEMEIAEHKSHNNSTQEYLNDVINVLHIKNEHKYTIANLASKSQITSQKPV